MKYNLFTKCRPHRLYLNDLGQKIYVSVTSKGALQIVCDDPTLKKHIKKVITEVASCPITTGLTTYLLEDIVKQMPSNLFDISTDEGLDNVVSLGLRQGKVIQNKFKSEVKSLAQLASDASKLDISTIKLRAKTAQKCSMIVDDREPKELFRLLEKSQLQSVDVARLPLGDILITNGESELIIERKNITDYAASITQPDHRAHRQVEAYYAYQQEQAKKGIPVKFIWIIEGEDYGSRGIYNTLPMIQQMDGFVNYQIAISDQYVATAFNINHLAYLAVKFTQGWFERRLTNAVRVNNVRIDLKHEKSTSTLTASDSDRGVTQSKNNLTSLLSYIPNIRSNVAKELASCGKTFAEIVQMTESELLEVKGVSKKSATAIFESFHMK
jgi:ERCC4-type nuclease